MRLITGVCKQHYGNVNKNAIISGGKLNELELSASGQSLLKMTEPTTVNKDQANFESGAQGSQATFNDQADQSGRQAPLAQPEFQAIDLG